MELTLYSIETERYVKSKKDYVCDCVDIKINHFENHIRLNIPLSNGNHLFVEINQNDVIHLKNFLQAYTEIEQ
jgi:hypothetical protein